MPSVLGAAEGFLRVEPLGGLLFVSNSIQNEERRDRHFVRTVCFCVALKALREARTSAIAIQSVMTSMNSRFFNTMRTLRHDNPLVLNACFIHSQFTKSFPTGSPEAWRTPDDAASWTPTKARHSARQKGRRCCQRQGRRGQEHGRRSVLPTSLFSCVAI